MFATGFHQHHFEVVRAFQVVPVDRKAQKIPVQVVRSNFDEEERVVGRRPGWDESSLQQTREIVQSYCEFFLNIMINIFLKTLKRNKLEA